MDTKLRKAYLQLNKAIQSKKLPKKADSRKYLDAVYWQAHYIRTLQDIAVYLKIIK